MSHNLTPMQVCERLIGNPETIGRAVGYQGKAAFHWRHERQGRAAGDLPSATVMRRLLAHAAAHQIPLTADHLIWGASEAEIETLLAQMADAPPAFISRRTPHQEAAE